MRVERINRAIVRRLRSMFSGHGFEGIKVYPSDLSEPIERPSVKLVIEDVKTLDESISGISQTLSLNIYFFARNAHRPKSENLAALEVLQTALRGRIRDEDGVVYRLDNLEISITDGVVVCSLDLWYMEINTEPPISDIIEENTDIYDVEVMQNLEVGEEKK